MPRAGGFIPEPLGFKDYGYEQVFGAGEVTEDVKPLGRDISGIPIVYQGALNTCVSCTLTWIRQWLDKTRPDLSHEWLAKISNTVGAGATPSQVLVPARKTGIVEQKAWDSLGDNQELEMAQILFIEAAKYKLTNYFYIQDITKSTLYAALRSGPLAIGVLDFRGIGPHMMAAIDFAENTDFIKCVNWWDPDIQAIAEVPVKDIVTAIYFDQLPENKTKKTARIPLMNVLQNKTKFFKRPLFSLLIAGLLFGSLLIPKAPKDVPEVDLKAIESLIDQKIAAIPDDPARVVFGSAGIAGKFRTTLSSSITSAGASVVLSSATLGTGEIIGAAGEETFYFPTYFTINPGGSTEEDVECWGYTTSTRTLTGCVRGLSWIASNTTSTVTGAAFAHAAGETVIQSNTPFFFNRFIDTFTSQNVTGTKTFLANGGNIRIGDGATSTGKFIYFVTGQTNPSYFRINGPQAGRTTSTFLFSLDGSSELELNASGTTVGASSTRGVSLVGGLLQGNASASTALGYDTANSNGDLTLFVSSTASDNGGFLLFSTSSVAGDSSTLRRLIWDIRSFIARAITWTGAHIFSGSVTFNGNVTSTANFAVPYSSASSSAASVGYVNNSRSDDFYGDGSDGALSISSGTTTLNTANKSVYQYTDVSITGTAVLTTGANLQNGAVVILVDGDLTITSTHANTVNVVGRGAGGGAGGPTAASSGSSGLVGSTAYRVTASTGGANGVGDDGGGGAGGAGLGNAGSNGTAASGAGGTAGLQDFFSTSSTISRFIAHSHVGSGGGGGAAGNHADADGGAGGAGGGSIIFIVRGNINIGSVTLNAAGENGAAGSTVGLNDGGGGGGGGGGFIGIFYAGSVTADTGTYTVAGGSGGSSGGAGVGGAGGAGRAVIREIKSHIGI